MTSPLTCITTSIDETHQLAQQIAKLCQPGDCVALFGDLGAGKTCFTQGFITHTANVKDVQSPTFLLIKPYEGYSWPIYHMDLYRIESEEELEELGLEEYFANGVSLIEWPQIAHAYLPDNVLEVTISIEPDNKRKFLFNAKGDWQERLNNVHLPLC